MGRTSFKNYAVATLTGSLIVTVFLILYAMAGTNYDTTILQSDVDGLNSISDFEQINQDWNETANEVYGIQSDKNLFDVIGGLILGGIKTIKTFITSANVIFNIMGSMAGLSTFFFLPEYLTYIIAIISISFASVLLFKYFANKEDEI